MDIYYGQYRLFMKTIENKSTARGGSCGYNQTRFLQKVPIRMPIGTYKKYIQSKTRDFLCIKFDF